MIYRRRRRSQFRSGYYRFESESRRCISGFGEGDYVRLHDEFGNVWVGQADLTEDSHVRFLFRDHQGRRVSGVGDWNGIVLRDERGNTWRGYID
jgi:hypothetical protein